VEKKSRSISNTQALHCPRTVFRTVLASPTNKVASILLGIPSGVLVTVGILPDSLKLPSTVSALGKSLLGTLHVSACRTVLGLFAGGASSEGREL